MNVSIVAGGAGFIGSNLLPHLVTEGRVVLVLDNLCRGKESYIAEMNSSSIYFRNTELSTVNETMSAFEYAKTLGQVDEIWHLAANSDIPAGVMDAHVDLNDTFMTTFALLEAMKSYGIGTMHFASSSAIYGDLGDVTLHESIGPLLPISNYGAMKLASEALISSAAEAYLGRANLFRFPNVVGVPATHGVILDFINKLASAPESLEVLGDGTQQKSYLHVSDLISAMLHIRQRNLENKVEVVNIGPIDTGVTVRWIANQVISRVSPSADIVFGIGNKGWVGDVPKFNYSTDLLQSYGWKPLLDSEAAVTQAVDEIAKQQGF